MTKKVLAALAAAAFLAVLPLKAEAAGAAFNKAAGTELGASTLVQKVKYSAHTVADILEDRGYYAIAIDDRKPPLYRYTACKRGKFYHLKVDDWGNIVRRKHKGSCGGGTHVRAPFTAVDVNRGRVRVRAPFVNLRIGR